MATNKNFEVKNGLTIAGTERISSAGAFTGSLASATTAATQSAADSSTKIATTAYTDAAITALIGGAPSALNDLNELAAAIADDANYSTTLTTALATKLPLSGGAMTGAITTNSTFDGVDIATRDAILTSTTTTANAALPKAGGTMTGQLNIVDSSATFGSIITNNNDGSQGLQVRTSDNDSGLYILDLQTSSSATGTNYASVFNVAKSGTVTSTAGFTTGANTRVQSSSGMLFLNGPSALAFEVGAGSEKMRLTSTGLGIGTQSPDKLLEVSGTDVVAKFTGTDAAPPQIEFADSIGVQATIGLNGGHDFIIDTAGENVYIGSDAAASAASSLTILATGLVGIGTPSPTDPLTIHHGTPGIAFKDTSSNGEAFWQLDGTQVKFVNKSSAGEMMFGTTNARKMSLTQYGALHIDTAAGYTGREWVNENTAGSPLGGTGASGNTYQKLRLWVDGDVNLSQGRGIHFGDVTDGSPLCIREGAPSEHGTDKDRIEIWSRGQLSLNSERGRIATGDTSAAGTARSSAFYIKKKGQMGGTWEEVITTPNGGDQNTRVFEDWTGRWVMVGRFASDARASIQGTWSSVSGLSTATAQGTTTAFSADWGDAYPSEVRIMGCTDVEDYMDTRTIDFIYGNRPSGVHSYTPRQWKHFFAGGTVDGMTANAGGSPRFGFPVGYAYDGKGRWYNPNMHGMGMSDANTTNPIAAYSTATSNAFNWNTAADAKLLATHYRTFASQDVYQTTGFGQDDNVQGFYDSYPTEYTNMGGGVTGGGVHATLTSAVFILLKLHW